MKALVADDDFTSRLLLQVLLKPFGEVHLVRTGLEAIDAIRRALEAKAPFDLLCLDIMMPSLDGQQTLRRIRQLESANGVLVGLGIKVLMTTSLGDRENVLSAFREQCDGYLLKPIDPSALMSKLRDLELIPREDSPAGP